MLNLFGVKKSQKIWEPEHSKNYIERTLEIINLKDINVKYVGRKASSSTATGNVNKHLAEQKKY